MTGIFSLILLKYVVCKAIHSPLNERTSNLNSSTVREDFRFRGLNSLMSSLELLVQCL